MSEPFDPKELPPEVWVEPELPDELSDRIRRSALRVQRRRRIQRGTLGASLGVLLFVAGALVGRQGVAVEGGEDAARPPHGIVRDQELLREPADILTPTELEIGAELATGAAQSELYRQAGDAYLQRERDLRSAMRCYQFYLQVSTSESGSESRGQDSWLLASLRRVL